MKFLSYPKSIFLSLYLLISTLGVSFVIVFFSYLSTEKFSRKAMQEAAFWWLWTNIGMANIDIQVEFEEGAWRGDLRDEGGIYLWNHKSFYDVLSVFRVLQGRARKNGFKNTVSYAAKSELFKIPFFGRAQKIFGNLPIYRTRPEKVFNLYRKYFHRISQGHSYILSPEGGALYGGGDKNF